MPNKAVVDPSEGETQCDLAEQIELDQAISGDSVQVTGDLIWTTAMDDNLLLRLRSK